MKKTTGKVKKVPFKAKCLLLMFIFILGINSSVFASDISDYNKLKAEVIDSVELNDSLKLERVKIAEINAGELKVGYNEIYNDGENVIGVTLDSNFYDYIQPMAGGDSGWSKGTIPSTATLHPHRSTRLTDLEYTLYWNNNRISSVHSLDYRLGLGTVTNASLSIIRRTASATPASAIAELQYVVTEAGLVVGSYNNWLRSEINASGQFRLVWNY